MPAPETIRLYGTVPDSIVDGPGLRYAVFVQGCSHACPGCHNPESQPHEGGVVRSIASVVTEIQANGLVKGVTLSGGEPFEQAASSAELARRLKELGYGVWTYTGYQYEDLLARAEQDGAVSALLDATDVLVDGPYVVSLRSLGLRWCGSSNQRLIDVSASREAGSVVLWETREVLFRKPPSW